MHIKLFNNDKKTFTMQSDRKAVLQLALTLARRDGFLHMPRPGTGGGYDFPHCFAPNRPRASRTKTGMSVIMSRSDWRPTEGLRSIGDLEGQVNAPKVGVWVLDHNSAKRGRRAKIQAQS